MAEWLVDADGRPELTQFCEDGFVDCCFRVFEVSSSPLLHRLSLLAVHEGQPVGFVLEVRRGLRGSLAPDMSLIGDHVYRPAARFLRAGSVSDRLVRVLSSLYGSPAIEARMAEASPFTGIVLHQDDVDMEVQAFRVKLFGADGPDDAEDDYCESFLRLDVAHGWACWNEKDPDYRPALLRYITHKPTSTHT